MTLKIVHTSDWHLGQLFYNLSREAEHREFLNWLLVFLKTSNADALLIAGDVFDTGNPPASAQHLYYSFLSDLFLELPQIQVVVIGGNHDSAARLDAPALLLKHLRVAQVGGLPTHTPEKAVVPLYNKHGVCEAWVLAVPFLRPSDLSSLGQLPEMAESETLQEATERVYSRITEAAKGLRQPGQALIGMGHCYMAGGELSELSERKIQRGNQEVLGVNIFSDDLSYVALGHLHKAQRVGNCNHIRYSGSPIPLSFSERNYKHQVLLVEFENGALTSVTEMPVKRSIELLSVPARHAPLAEVLVALAELSEKYPKGNATQHLPYVEVRVELDKPEPQLRPSIEKALEQAAVHLVRIESRTKSQSSDSGFNSLQKPPMLELSQVNPLDLFARKYAGTYSNPPSDELISTFHELVSLVHAKEGA